MGGSVSVRYQGPQIVPLFLVLCFSFPFFISFAITSFKRLTCFVLILSVFFFFLADYCSHSSERRCGTIRIHEKGLSLSLYIFSSYQTKLHSHLINWSHLIHHQIFSLPHHACISLCAIIRVINDIYASSFYFLVTRFVKCTIKVYKS